MVSSVHEYLKRMVQRGASDLHVKPGNRPGLRIDGRMVPLEGHDIIAPGDAAALAQELMSPEQLKRFEAERDLDFSVAIKDLARFRVNVMLQRGSVAFVVRLIPDTIPTLKSLGLPDICREFAEKPRGLVLVTGPTGSGKSTTLAAMTDWINSTRQGHILTMEDPIEFVHRDKECYVTQRQIGQDTPSFQEGLRRALRQDPDVILVGEMRDLETISMAITAAETGHLVLATLHTTSAISTVDRIIDVFSADQQQQVRIQLASTLQGVVSQCLLPKRGGGLTAALEVLVATSAVRALIREAKTPQLLNVMQMGARSGMGTLEAELANLVMNDIVDLDDAVARANRPDEVLGVAGARKKKVVVDWDEVEHMRRPPEPQEPEEVEADEEASRNVSPIDGLLSSKKSKAPRPKPSSPAPGIVEGIGGTATFRPKRGSS